MAFLRRFRLGPRIFIGYGLLLLLMGLIGGIGILRLSGISQAMNGLSADNAQDMRLAEDMRAAVLELRMVSSEYLESERPALLDRRNRQISALEALFAQAGEAFTEPRQQEWLAEAQQAYQSFNSSFQQAQGLLEERQRIVDEVLNNQAPLAVSKLGQARAIAAQSQLDQFVEQAESGSNAILNMRVYVFRYLENGDPKWVIEADNQYKLASGILNTLNLNTEEKSLKMQLQWAINGLEGFNQGFKDVQANLHQMEGLRTMQLDGQGIQIQEVCNEIAVDAQDRFDQVAAETNQVVENTRRLTIAVLAGAAAVSVIVAVLVSLSIVRPLRAFTASASAMAEGDFHHQVDTRGRDEVSDLARALANMMGYLQEMAGAADAIAERNLTGRVEPRSERDLFGRAFQNMQANLRRVVSETLREAQRVNHGAAQMLENAGQSSAATEQIAATMHQLTLGAASQSEGIARTAASLEQMTHAIDGIARGAQEQAQAVGRAARTAEKMSQAISEVADGVQQTYQRAVTAGGTASAGVTAVNHTVAVIEDIRRKVDISAQKVQHLGKQSGEIGMIVETIRDIAGQTNLLALNAAIEAARANGKTIEISQSLLQNHLVAAAQLLSDLDARSNQPLRDQDLTELAQRARVDTLLISDPDGVITITNEAVLNGFRFSEDPREQASAFRPLLKQRDGIVVQAPQPRSKDGMLFMWVGVSRRKQPGIIQAGINAQSILKFVDVTRGFGVVADEVRKLAEKSAVSSKEIAGLVKSIQGTVTEVVRAMQDSAEGVQLGVAQAGQSGAALQQMIEAMRAVQEDVERAAQAAELVRLATGELNQAMEAVSAVVEENTASTEEMAAGAQEVEQAMQGVAAVNQENSAALEEVSAGASEVSGQTDAVRAAAEELVRLARGLEQLVGEYRLPDGRPAGPPSRAGEVRAAPVLVPGD